MTSSAKPIEREFTVNGLKIAAKEWHPESKLHAIALHGWLDNANSFDMLAPLLPELNLMAIDCAGHGKSDFRSADAPYLIWSDIAEVIGIADQLGWDKFVLIGHSRGANIASMIAGTFPARLSHLVLIEGGIPSFVEPEKTPEQLANSIIEDQQAVGTTGTLFPTFERAVAARAEGFISVDIATAETLAARSLLSEDGGYRWRADPRLKLSSHWKLSEPQRQAFFDRMTMPILLIEAVHGLVDQLGVDVSPLLSIPTLKRLDIPGKHHFHMEGSEAAIGEQISAFVQ